LHFEDRPRKSASSAGVALFFPGVAVGVVAVAFPEAQAVVVQKHEAAHLLHTFPGVEMRHHKAHGAAVFTGERLAIMLKREEHIGALQTP
jgi:hypothetical protein